MSRDFIGAERKSIIDDKNRKIVALHESGHALVAWYTQGSDPIHKATIMPRGQALGMVSD
jgi:ATP-dependent Zn protease